MNEKTMWDLMLGGMPFMDTAEMKEEHKRAVGLLQEYNAFRNPDILKALLGACGERVHIEPPFHCDYGKHVYLGNHIYINFNCIMLDGGGIHIGNDVLVGPRVSFYSVSHPIDPIVRNTLLEYGSTINVCDKVWIGGSCTINPGVTIGENSVIGAGSVVTRSIPANVVAYGVPCRVKRSITDEDKKYCEQQLAEFYARGIES